MRRGRIAFEDGSINQLLDEMQERGGQIPSAIQSELVAREHEIAARVAGAFTAAFKAKGATYEDVQRAWKVIDQMERHLDGIVEMIVDEGTDLADEYSQDRQSASEYQKMGNAAKKRSGIIKKELGELQFNLREIKDGWDNRP